MEVDIREKARIDALLGRLERFWTEVPEVSRTIGHWDPRDQIDYTDDVRPTNEEALLELGQYAQQRLLSPEQQARYEALVALIKRNRPLLDEIMHG